MAVMGTDDVVAALVLVWDPKIICTNRAWKKYATFVKAVFL
jgi:hypothetical protein